MPPSQFIIDFNRCFEPSPFNTGPSIPSRPTIPLTPLLPLASLPEILRGGTPDLSSSPSSTVSSVLTLESDEIKRIFSFPGYDRLDFEAFDHSQQFSLFEQYGMAHSVNLHQDYPPFSHLGLEHFDDFNGAQKDKLNPHAPAFVPTFSSSLHNRIESDFDAEPLNLPLLGFHEITLPEHGPPPGLPHPPAFAPPSSSSHLANMQSSPYVEPAYLPLLIQASHETTTVDERVELICSIVKSRDHWTIECLLELAECISVGALFPGAILEESGIELRACAPSRYVPAEPQQAETYAQEDEEQKKPEDILADITSQLHDRFNELHGVECSRAFLWNVRELVLVRFKQAWDSSQLSSVSFQGRTTPLYVRSSLALCKSLAAFFKRGLFTPRNVDVCVKILLQGLTSVEYAEALATLVLACGKDYFSPEEEPPLGEYERLSSLLESIQTNPTTPLLSDDMSVVYQPWGKGQVHARLSHLTDTLKVWAEAWKMTTES